MPRKTIGPHSPFSNPTPAPSGALDVVVPDLLGQQEKEPSPSIADILRDGFDADESNERILSDPDLRALMNIPLELGEHADGDFLRRGLDDLAARMDSCWKMLRHGDHLRSCAEDDADVEGEAGSEKKK